jgi:hypothetical protein
MRSFCPFAVTFMGNHTIPLSPRVCPAVPSVNAIPTTDTPELGKGDTASHCIHGMPASRAKRAKVVWLSRFWRMLLRVALKEKRDGFWQKT